MSIFICMLMNIDIYTNHIREIIHESIRKLEPHVQFETGGASRDHCQPSIYNNKQRKLRLFLLPIDPSHVRGRQPGWSPATCGTLAHMASGRWNNYITWRSIQDAFRAARSHRLLHLPAGRLRSYSLFFSHYQTRLAGQFYISHVNPCHTVGRK